MPDLATGTYLWLICVALVAGLVRGFAGFGTALIYVPLASLALPPLWVIVSMTVMDLIGPLPNVPAAWRDGLPRQVAILALAAACALIPGLWALDRLPADGFRWLVGILCAVTVALMACGWRWSGPMTLPLLVATGALSGFLGGVSGLSGPPVILAYMAQALPTATIRATILLYLVAWEVVFAGTLAVTGRLSSGPLLLGAALVVPYLTANILGARLFRPGREHLYRSVAYTIIAGAALLALPIWSRS